MDFLSKFGFLVKFWIFIPNLNFCKNLDFWSKLRYFGKISIFNRKFLSRVKNFRKAFAKIFQTTIFSLTNIYFFLDGKLLQSTGPRKAGPCRYPTAAGKRYNAIGWPSIPVNKCRSNSIKSRRRRKSFKRPSIAINWIKSNTNW